MSKKIFVVYYYISPYDGQGCNRVFSTLKRAVEYCASQPESERGHPKNPFQDDPHGLVIEEHEINDITATIKYYNGNGVLFYEGKASY